MEHSERRHAQVLHPKRRTPGKTRAPHTRCSLRPATLPRHHCPLRKTCTVSPLPDETSTLVQAESAPPYRRCRNCLRETTPAFAPNVRQLFANVTPNSTSDVLTKLSAESRPASKKLPRYRDSSARIPQSHTSGRSRVIPPSTRGQQHRTALTDEDNTRRFVGEKERQRSVDRRSRRAHPRTLGRSFAFPLHSLHNLHNSHKRTPPVLSYTSSRKTLRVWERSLRRRCRCCLAITCAHSS